MRRLARQQGEHCMSDSPQWFAGIDWASEAHHVHLIDHTGKTRGERVFKHSGEGLAQMADWLIATTGAQASAIQVAIETPHGPIVEMLLERGFQVYAINPKQLDRFRDRFSPAGAKDDSRDSLVMASALRTDAHALRKLEAADPYVVELREWNRIAEDLTTERVRLTNRLRQQLWRYFPVLLAPELDLGSDFFLDLWQAAPTPDKARRLRQASLERLIKRHKIRRFDAQALAQILAQPKLAVEPATVAAATGHVAILIPRIRLINRQIAEAGSHLDRLIAILSQPLEAKPGQESEQRDAAILASLPGLGRMALATLLAEAFEAVCNRDYQALRTLAGVAPVTKRSGKMHIVVRRHACHKRLANALYHWARVAVQHDPPSRDKYKVLRARGHSHGRALRSIADRLLKVACAMLKSNTLFNPQLHAKNTP
jgi:transposase